MFTKDEVRRADVFLEAGHQDTDRLAAIAARLGNGATGDEAWLVQQLTTTWARLDELRVRIDDGGSLMAKHPCGQRHRLRPRVPAVTNRPCCA